MHVLRVRGNAWMTTSDLADAVNDRGRYRKQDTSPVTAFQVHGRARQYAKLFERNGSRIRLAAARSTTRTITEQRYLMHQWSRPQWESENAAERQGKPLRHSASDAVEYSRLKPGDRLYIVGQEKGMMLLLGRMDVDRVTSNRQLVDELLGPDLYEAKYHVLADDCTAIRFDLVVPEGVVRSITTERGAHIAFATVSEYRLKPSSLQPRMWLDEASAQALDRLLESVPTNTRDTEPVVCSVPIDAAMPEDYKVETKAMASTAVRREHRLVREYVSYMERQGDAVDHHEIRVDEGSTRLVVDIFNKTRDHLIEAKAHSTRIDVRMAIGQLADYGRFSPDARRAVLLPVKPDDDLLALLSCQGIDAIWKDGPSFYDTADGEFTTRRRSRRIRSAR